MLRCILLFLLLVCTATLCVADDAEQRVLERYKEILVKSPKRGTTFDRVYGHYVDTGQNTLLYQECQAATQNKPNDAGAWLLFGLVAERRNKTEEAAQAFQTAATLEPNNHLPMLYLGELLLNQRRIHEAITALEQAHERLQKNTGSKNDQRTVLQTLALAYTRFGNPQKSLEVWNQLADLFPNDPDILVQVAETLESEGRLDDALKQYRRLITMTDDPAERVRTSLAAIDIMLRQNNDESALADLDSLLGSLDTESYLADAVRDRIDRIFERSRDTKRQIDFYQKRIKQEPNDTSSLLRLVKTLRQTDKSAEAEKLLLDTIKVSPSNITLRLALIDLLAERKEISGAVEQFQAIDKLAPPQVDYLTRWGTLVLQHPDMTESERRTEAAKIWNRIVEPLPNNLAPNDPVALVQTADLFLRNKFEDEAERCYKNALALRPNDFAYREYLATFYHQQRRKDKVLETLRLAERSKAETGQLLLTLGYIDESANILRQAVEASPQDWTLQYRYLETLLRQNTPESFAEAVQVWNAGEKKIADDEQFALFLQQEVQLLKSLQKTAEVIKLVQSNLTTTPTVRSYWHLAVLHQAEGNLRAAVDAIEKALDQTPPLPLLRFAAELYEQNGSTDKTIALYQKLAQDDPARSGNYWQQIITLQIQRGELPLALESSQKLLGRGMENAERLRFVADLFLNVNRPAEAVKLLRQALTYEPGNADVLRILARTLAEADQHEEAIELLWRLYERLEHLPAKLSVIELLASEYNKTDRNGELVERLQQLSRNYERRREAMQSLVRVLSLRGEYDEAQAVLENMLDLPEDSKAESDSPHWTLRELVALSEKQNDFASAARYQEMLCQKSQDAKEQELLFYLYDKLGDTAKSKKLFFDQVLRQENLQDRLRLIDTMIRQGQYEMVLQVLDFLTIHEPEHWQIMFRRLLVEAYQNKPVESLVHEFRSKQFSDTSPPNQQLPTLLPGSRQPTSFIFYDVAPDDLNISLSVQEQFWSVLFHPEAQKARQDPARPISEISVVQTLQDAQFLSLGFLLRKAITEDFAAQNNNPAEMPQFRNTVETLRDMFPADSAEYDVLMDRLRLEVWLSDLLRLDTTHHVFPAGLLELQIDEHVCQHTIRQIVRKSALDGVADWQPALFQIFITECLNELIANQFTTELSSDVKLSEKLSQILDNLCYTYNIPPIPAEERNKMLNEATRLVKRSATDHQAGLAENNPLTLSQKTDRLLSIWSEFVENAGAETRTKHRHHLITRYGMFIWILQSQNRDADVKSLEQSFLKTAQSHPLWFAEHMFTLVHCIQPLNEETILFPLMDYIPLEMRLHQIETYVIEVLPFCTDIEEKRAFCQWLFRHLGSFLWMGQLKRYDIFTPSEQDLIRLPTARLWNYLLVPSTSQQGRVFRQFFGIDAYYAAQQQILNPDQMTRLAELDRSLQQMTDFAFYVLHELQLEPSDLTPALATPAERTVSLSRYRSELQGDRPIDRTIIYSLIQNPAAVNNFSPVDDLFFRILLIRRGLDTKAPFTGTKTENTFVPIQGNYTEQLFQFLENRKQSPVAADRNWSQHFSATFGDLLQRDTQPTGKTIIEPSSDTELLQIVQKLETEQKDRSLPLAEKTAQALLYVRLQRFDDAAAILDSMELTPADLPVREWIIACLAVQYAEPDSPLKQRGREAVERLLNFRLSERDTMNLVLLLQHYQRGEEAQKIYDHLAVTVSDQHLLSELFYRLNAQGELQKDNVVKIAQRILLNPAFLQNSRRLTSDIFLLEAAMKVLRQQNQAEAVVLVLETRLRGLQNKTDSRILLATLYQNLDRQEEAKALALELAQHPTLEPERRQKIVSLLLHFGLQRELEAMNRLLLEQNQQP